MTLFFSIAMISRDGFSGVVMVTDLGKQVFRNSLYPIQVKLKK